MFLQPAFQAVRPILAIIGMAGDRPAPLARHLRGAILCLGNFDGLHRGHDDLLDRAAALAQATGRPLALMSCEPHPRSFFAPAGHRPFRLASALQKRILLAERPVDYLFEPGFDAAFAALSPDRFLRVVLRDHLQIGGIVTGSDFRFGAGRAGDAGTIRAFCAEQGLLAVAVDKTVAASSTAAREALLDRDFAAVRHQLGRDWQIDLRATGVQMRPPAGRYIATGTQGGGTPMELVIHADGTCAASPERHGRFLALTGTA